MTYSAYPHILTLVAGTDSKDITPAHTRQITDILEIGDVATNWLKPHRAIDLNLPNRPTPEKIRARRAVLDVDRIDFFISPVGNRLKKLLLADMDATIIAGETLDEVAQKCGIGEQVSSITARAMAGEIDFRAALAERLALLRDTPIAVLHDIRDHLTPNAGAATLIATLRAHGCTCVLVSGGFTVFTGHVAKTLGFDHHHGNTLLLEGERIAGKITEPVINGTEKHRLLLHHMQEMQLNPDNTAAVGDGANDLAMLQSASLGVGYRPKAVLREKLDNLILYADLTALLYAMGIPAEKFVHAS
jgi:phosphoserine phosphatase